MTKKYVVSSAVDTTGYPPDGLAIKFWWTSKDSVNICIVLGVVSKTPLTNNVKGGINTGTGLLS